MASEVSFVYGVKVIYKYEIGQETFYEEQILKIRAESFDDAFKKAREYAENNIDHNRTNINGDKVKETVCDVVDCYLADDDDSDVQEIFSSIKKNRASLSEEEYIEILGGGCDAEEMYILRYR